MSKRLSDLPAQLWVFAAFALFGSVVMRLLSFQAEGSLDHIDLALFGSNVVLVATVLISRSPIVRLIYTVVLLAGMALAAVALVLAYRAVGEVYWRHLIVIVSSGAALYFLWSKAVSAVVVSLRKDKEAALVTLKLAAGYLTLSLILILALPIQFAVISFFFILATAMTFTLSKAHFAAPVDPHHET